MTYIEKFSCDSFKNQKEPSLTFDSILKLFYHKILLLEEATLVENFNIVA